MDRPGSHGKTTKIIHMHMCRTIGAGYINAPRSLDGTVISVSWQGEMCVVYRSHQGNKDTLIIGRHKWHEIVEVVLSEPTQSGQKTIKRCVELDLCASRLTPDPLVLCADPGSCSIRTVRVSRSLAATPTNACTHACRSGESCSMATHRSAHALRAFFFNLAGPLRNNPVCGRGPGGLGGIGRRPCAWL